MLPDIKYKDYYLNYIYSAKNDIRKYNECINTLNKSKEELIKYIEDNKHYILESFNINLDNYDVEWGKKEYNSTEHLYNFLIKYIITIDIHPHKIHLLQVIKYLNVLRNIYRYNKLKELATKRKNMSFSTYRKYIFNYYNKVHKCVLEGMGYKFGGGIGTYVINHWKLDPKLMKKKPILDYAASNARKRELITQGKKVYDDKEAAWYAARNIPYDAIDYRVWRENTDWYEFTFLKSDLAKSSRLDYQRSEYVSLKYRNMSYQQICDTFCKTYDDIYNLQVDIKYKLNMLLYKDPTKYINFVRNAEQCKYKRGAHNS